MVKEVRHVTPRTSGKEAEKTTSLGQKITSNPA